jgi:hypothetical protein
MLAVKFYQPPLASRRPIKRRKLSPKQQPVLEQPSWYEIMPSFVPEPNCSTEITEGNSLSRAQRHYDANIHAGTTREKSREPTHPARDSTLDSLALELQTSQEPASQQPAETIDRSRDNSPDSLVGELHTPDEPASQKPVEMTGHSRDNTPDSLIDYSTAELNANQQASYTSPETHNKSGMSTPFSYVQFDSNCVSGRRETP